MNDYWNRLIELERRAQRLKFDMDVTRNDVQRVASEIGTVSSQLPDTILRPVIEGDCFTWSDTVCLRLNSYEHQPSTAGVNVTMNSGSSGFVWFRSSPTQWAGPYSHTAITTLSGTTFRMFRYLTLTKIRESPNDAEYLANAANWMYYVRLTKGSGVLAVFFTIVNNLGGGFGAQRQEFVIYNPSGFPVGNQPTPGVPGINGSATISGLARFRWHYLFPTPYYHEFGTGAASVTISWGNICGPPMISPIAVDGGPSDPPHVTKFSGPFPDGNEPNTTIEGGAI